MRFILKFSPTKEATSLLRSSQTTVFSTDPFDSPNQTQRRIELLTSQVYEGQGNTNFPERSHTRGCSTGDA